MAAASPITAAELERLHLPNKQVELIRGQLVVREPPGTWHGRVAARLTLSLGTFTTQHGLGEVFAQDTGFKIARDPDTVRAPDVAFVLRERLVQIPDEGYADLAPDWVTEILSPSDRPGEVLDKVGQWLSAGVRLVWVIDRGRRQARVYRADGTVTIVEADGMLDGEDVFPGLGCPLGDIL